MPESNALPKELPPRRPEPVPVWDQCARCFRTNGRHGDRDWVLGFDDCAYVAGVVCPGCITPDERRKLNGLAVEELVEGITASGVGVYINPADDDE